MMSAEGEHNPLARLTDAEVGEIKALYLTGEHSYSDLAWRFHVRKTTIQQIINGERWDHLLEAGEAQALAEMREQRNHNYRR
jgi:hypothetical protein